MSEMRRVMTSRTALVLAGALMLLPVRAGAQTLISLRDAVMLAVRHDSRGLDAGAVAGRPGPAGECAPGAALERAARPAPNPAGRPRDHARSRVERSDRIVIRTGRSGRRR